MKLKIKKAYVIIAIVFQVIYTAVASFLIRDPRPQVAPETKKLFELPLGDITFSIDRPELVFMKPVINPYTKNINIDVFVFRVLVIILLLTLLVGLYNYFKAKRNNKDVE